MKERPILFSGPMVRAILDGQKTQTRRVFKTAPSPDIVRWEPWSVGGDLQYRDSGIPLWLGGNDKDEWYEYGCPYGEVGDRLWVRETFFDNNCPGYGTPGSKDYAPAERDLDYVIYRADWPNGGPDLDGESVEREGGGWKPSIHMPRWASRLTLEITDIRVERLQDISEDDARDEGAVYAYTEAYKREHGHYPAGIIDASCAVGQFAALWDSINEKRGYSWESNPWVWAITFRRVDDAQEQQQSAGGESR